MKFWLHLFVSFSLGFAPLGWSMCAFASPQEFPFPAATAPRGHLFCTNDWGELRCWRQNPPPITPPVTALPEEPPPPVGDTQTGNLDTSVVAFRVEEPPPPVGDAQTGPALLAATAPTDAAPLAGELLAPDPSGAPPVVFPREIFVAIHVNERRVEDFARVLQISPDAFYASAEQFARWRIELPAAAPLLHEGVPYFPLQSSGITCRLASAQQALFLRVPAPALVASVFNLREHPTGPITESAPGLFLNHNLQGSYATGRWTVAGLMELGLFSRLGVLTTRLADRDLTGGVRPYRLDTQFVRDFPARMATLAIGDSISASSPFSRQVRYGGIRWASKFSTQPNFVPFALPGLNGTAALPSAVDIYVDNVRTARQQVDSGPFSIHNVPALNGQGELRMVVTDVLGRQQVVSLPYITSTQLLRRGVTEYTYESGSLRRGFGTSGAGYHSFFVSGTQRWGFSDLFTLNAHSEVLARQQSFAIGADYGLAALGVLGGGAALSHSSAGAGYLLYGSAQHKARSFSASVSVQLASPRFRQLGMFPGESPLRIMGQAQLTRALGSHGSLAIGYVRREPYKNLVPAVPNPLNGSFRAYTASAGWRLAGRAFLSMTTNYSPGPGQRPTAAVSLIIPLGERMLLVAGSDIDQNGATATAEVSRQLPAGNGYGYKVRTNLHDAERTDAGLFLQNDLGTIGFEAGRAGRQVNWRLSEAGSLVLLKNHIMFSRRIDDSFALIEVPGGKGIRVFANNQFITRTNSRGLALVPRLVPYDRNSLYLDDEGVPIELGVDFVEKTITPMPRTGVLVKFNASTTQGALFELVTEDDAPLPIGSEVRVNGGSEIFLVALHGEVFVSAFSFPATLAVRWETGHCQARVPGSPANEPLPRIGPVVCR